MMIRQAEKGDYKKIKDLYVTAFPKNERAPFFFIKNRVKKKRAEMLVAERDGEFVGFMYTVVYNDLVYLFYFAVSEEKRGMGCGSEIIGILKEHYSGKNIFLAREPLDETADNNAQRVRRREFYIRNGFVDLPLRIIEAGVIYDLMSTDKAFDSADYDLMMRNWAGEFVIKRVTMKCVKKS